MRINFMNNLNEECSQFSKDALKNNEIRKKPNKRNNQLINKLLKYTKFTKINHYH